MIIYRGRQKNYSTPFSRALSGFNRNVLGKSRIASNRAAIVGRNRISNIKNSINEVVMNPGKAVNSGLIQPSIETPVTAVALNAVPIPGSSALVKVVGKPEKTLYKRIGWGDKLQKLSERYPNTTLAKNIEGGINGVLNYGKALAI